MNRLAIIATHPIQYQAPWFRTLVSDSDLHIHVFYLWHPSTDGNYDHGFKRKVVWDIPLTDGYPHTFVPNISRAAGTHSFWGLNNPTLSQAIATFEPDATLCLSYRNASMMRFFARYSRNAHGLLLMRGDSHVLLETPSFRSLLKRTLLTILFKRFSACLYVGDASYSYFRYLGLPAKALFFCPHALNPVLFPKNEDTPATNNCLRMLFCGKLEEKKQPTLLLKTFIQLSIENSELHFVGDGPLRTELESLARDQTNVFFHGFVNQTQIASHYQRAALLVLPSRGRYETWGLVVQEAAMTATPSLVSSHVGCASDLVIDGKTGYVFDADSPDSLTASLLRIANNRGSLPHTGMAAFENVKSYTYATATSGLMQALSYVWSRDHE